MPHEPALRQNLEIEAPHFLEGAAHQVIPVATGGTDLVVPNSPWPPTES